MRIAVTGPTGFLGFHFRAWLLAHGHDEVLIDRALFAAPRKLAEALAGVDGVVQFAGVNRADNENDITTTNADLAHRLDVALEARGPIPVVYANSTHSERDGVFGDAKRAAAATLADGQARRGGRFVDLIIPHAFGEFGVPFYNSGVTTFAHQLATGQVPEIHRDGQLELLHAQSVSAAALEGLAGDTDGRIRLTGRSISVGQAWDLLASQHDRYVHESTVPSFADEFELRMFNMLRSQLWQTGHYPVAITQHADQRGAFSELARADGTGQTSISTSVPGITRGDHWHFDKIERFVVVSGTATIRVRRLFSENTHSFDVSGDVPSFIDMPPLCTHNITNTGDDIMTTMFWSGDHFDPDRPDTIPRMVETRAASESGAA